MKKSIPVFALISRIVFVVSAGLNLILSTRSDSMFGLSIWNVACLVVWTYAFLGSLGFIKFVVSEEEDGTIVYDTPFPIIQIGVLRVLQLGFMLWRHKSVFDYKVFIILVVVDALYAAFLLIDKSTNYYLSYGGDN